MRYNRGRDGAVIVFAEEEWSVECCVCLCVFAYVCKRERLFMCVRAKERVWEDEGKLSDVEGQEQTGVDKI